MKPAALVTGASGFLGRHLVSALREAGHPVVAWVRSPMTEAAVPDARFVPWPPLDGLSRAIETLDRPIVYHLAAAADRNAHNPAAQFETNIRLTAVLVQACAQSNARGFVYAGSCTEYGPTRPGLRISEKAPLASVNLYDASKAAAGLWAQAVARYAGMGFAWARLFALYGPGLRPPRLLPVVHASLRANCPVQLTPGAQMRDWLYVADAAEGLVRLGDYAAKGGQSVFNLCTGDAIATRDIVTRFAGRMGADLGLLRFGALPARPDEALWLVGDPAAAHELGWSARTDMDAGLDATIAALDRASAQRR